MYGYQLSEVEPRTESHSLLYKAMWRLAEFIFVSNQIQVVSAIRVMVLRLFGATIGSGCVIRPCRVHHPWMLVIGDRCHIGERTWIINPDKLIIGSDTMLSAECIINTGSHDITTMEGVTKPVVIGSRVWLTTRIMVMYGVTIDDGVVVTPGSIVSRSLEGSATGARIVYGGNPIRKLREVEV